jgi:hypothetical protein
LISALRSASREDSRSDLPDGLQGFQAARREDSISRVSAAIARIAARGEAVNFTNVANESGVSRKSLHKVAELKSLVLASKPAEAFASPTVSAVKTPADDRDLESLLIKIYDRIEKLGI